MEIHSSNACGFPRSFLLTRVLAGCLCVNIVFGATVDLSPLPTWFENANTTSQSYTFTTNSVTPSPEVEANPYGNPITAIDVVPSLGVGVGYLDPDPAFPSSSLNRDGGSWDLGPSGSMLFEVPIAPPPGSGQSYIVDVFVNVVYESNLYFPPSLLATPTGTVSISDTPNFDQIGIVRWGRITYQTSLSAVLGNTISLLLDPPGEQDVEGQVNSGSLVDQVDIHTRFTVVPEFRSYSLFLGLSVLLMVVHHRRRKCI